MSPRHPTIEECLIAGIGPPYNSVEGYKDGLIPNTLEERLRFEAYMRGHCWNIGKYDEQQRCYDTGFVRCLYGVWRDRGALPTVFAEHTCK